MVHSYSPTVPQPKTADYTTIKFAVKNLPPEFSTLDKTLQSLYKEITQIDRRDPLYWLDTKSLDEISAEAKKYEQRIDTMLQLAQQMSTLLVTCTQKTQKEVQTFPETLSQSISDFQQTVKSQQGVNSSSSPVKNDIEQAESSGPSSPINPNDISFWSLLGVRARDYSKLVLGAIAVLSSAAAGVAWYMGQLPVMLTATMPAFIGTVVGGIILAAVGIAAIHSCYKNGPAREEMSYLYDLPRIEKSLSQFCAHFQHVVTNHISSNTHDSE